MFVKNVVIDLQAIDEQIGAAVWVGIEAKPILVWMLDEMGIGDGEVQSGWCLIRAERVLSLLMNAAVVEYRE